MRGEQENIRECEYFSTHERRSELLWEVNEILHQRFRPRGLVELCTARAEVPSTSTLASPHRVYLIRSSGASGQKNTYYCTVTERNHEGGIPLFYYADLCMNKYLLILVDFEVDM